MYSLALQALGLCGISVHLTFALPQLLYHNTKGMQQYAVSCRSPCIEALHNNKQEMRQGRVH